MSFSEIPPLRRSPVFDITEHRERTLFGWLIVSAWLIMPPIDMPTTCIDVKPRASIRPAPSSAMSSIVYPTPLTGRRISIEPTVLRADGGSQSVLVDKPTSRLS